uniref:NADH-ubiquinone oxidoreductase chain 6 n=1 Tax=Candida verbasci TaxID=1227364 RepID=A0A977LKY2_9ASCO|nr:NADH dehydrogenase subunit 6 [Candida verbasci]UXG56588.1 NADH dehydrogenase subunit 6 [Candida verbasci]
MNMMSGMASLTAMGLTSPVQSIVAMMVLFVSTAISLYNSGYVLMGMLYVLVYVGAMAMLFLFMLSLLDMEYTHTPGMHPLTMSMLLVCLMPLDLSTNEMSMGMMESPYTVYNELNTMGMLLYTEYAMPMVMMGMVLVLSIMGAMAMAK